MDNAKGIASQPWAAWLGGAIKAMAEIGNVTGIILLVEHGNELMDTAYNMDEGKAIKMMGTALVHYHEAEESWEA